MTQRAPFMEGRLEAAPLPQQLQRKVSPPCPLSLANLFTTRALSIMLTTDMPSSVPDWGSYWPHLVLAPVCIAATKLKPRCMTSSNTNSDWKTSLQRTLPHSAAAAAALLFRITLLMLQAGLWSSPQSAALGQSGTCSK